EESPDFPPLEACVDAISNLDGLKDLPRGTRVLVRGDTDVVFDEQGQIDDDSRLRSLLETLKFGVEHGWVQIVSGHRGRDPQLSLKPVAEYVDRLLKDAGIAVPPITLVGDWMDDKTGEILPAAGAAASSLPAGGIGMLENTRK